MCAVLQFSSRIELFGIHEVSAPKHSQKTGYSKTRRFVVFLSRPKHLGNTNLNLLLHVFYFLYSTVQNIPYNSTLHNLCVVEQIRNESPLLSTKYKVTSTRTVRLQGKVLNLWVRLPTRLFYDDVSIADVLMHQIRC